METNTEYIDKTKSSSESYREWSDYQMGRHDRYNFEAKLDYFIEKNLKKQKKTEYYLDTYFFIPSSLQIHRDRYTPEMFFSDINNRIRFKTPQMSISAILDPNNDLSPIYIIKNRIKILERGNFERNVIERIDYELRILACLMKVTLRDQFQFFFSQFKQYKQLKPFYLRINQYYDQIIKFQEEFNNCKLFFQKPQIPIELREAFQFIEEYISLQIELWVTRSLKIFKETIPLELKEKAIKIIIYEQKHRKHLNSRIIIKEGNEIENEGITYWERILKKFAQSVLYLKVEPKDPKSSALELLYSIAAGAAMFVSLFLGLMIANRFEQNSIPYILALIVVYMLKDRIKENIRALSNKALGIVFPHRKYNIIDEYKNIKIGTSRETMQFMKEEEVPEQIIKIRKASSKTKIEYLGKPEEIILYRKKITLYNDKIEKIHRRHGNLSEIIRFNVREMIRYADDPYQKELIFDPKKQEIIEQSLPKVYHLNIIFHLRVNPKITKKKVYYKKVRVILDQNGIKRVVEPRMAIY
ncbi:MAG: hypothetical protein ACTSRZ_10305 [Promethearchaeota archaeon]